MTKDKAATAVSRTVARSLEANPKDLFAFN
jgi:hypothetical protein